MRTVAPGVKRITLPLALSSPDHVHCFVLDMPDDGPLLVDTGMRGSEEALRLGLEDAGEWPARVLVTHGHVDHWGLAATLTDQVLAHSAVRGSLDFDRQRDNVFGEHDVGVLTAETVKMAFAAFQRMIVGKPPAVDPIEDGQMLGDWEVVWTPGHDPGHVCLFREADGVLICGDSLLPDNTPNIQPAAGRQDSLADFLGSLARLAALPVQWVLPSHGEPYRDHAGRARELIEFHEARLANILTELEGGPRTVEEIARVIFPERDGPIDDMLADMETLAHLDHLRIKTVARRGSDHRWEREVAGIGEH